MLATILLLAALFGGPEVIQPVFVKTGPAPDETLKFQNALEVILQQNWNFMPDVRDFVLQVGSDFDENRRAVFTARLTAPDEEIVEFPPIPVRMTKPEEAAKDVWQNVRLALRAKKLCGTMKLCPAACTLSYSRDGPPPRFFYNISSSNFFVSVFGKPMIVSISPVVRVTYGRMRGSDASNPPPQP